MCVYVYLGTPWENEYKMCNYVRYIVYGVGQDYIYTLYVRFLGREITRYTVIYGEHIRFLWQGNHQIYGHIRCIYTVLANPI